MLRIRVASEQQSAEFEHTSREPLELGRGPARAAKRILVNDTSVSRDHLSVQELPDGRVRVKNLSLKIPVLLADRTCVEPGITRELELPILMTVGKTQIRVEAPSLTVTPVGQKKLTKEGTPAIQLTPGTPIDESGLRALSEPGPTPDRAQMRRLLSEPNATPTPETLAHWLETVIALQQAVTTSPEFYKQTARAVVDLVGLDLGLVVLWSDEQWVIQGSYATDTSESISVSQTLLDLVLKERQTFYRDVGSLRSVSASLRAIQAVVVAPIFGLHKEVVGVLYGVRTQDDLILGGISPLEAQFVQLLAAAVGASLARTAATRTRFQFEQFFSMELVRELERDASLLEGRNQEVTILFSDMRGFTGLSQQLGAHNTCRMVREMMELLTQPIIQYGGVIVDYVGDGILAMWNAPIKQADHAVRACRAALGMLGELPALNAKWKEVAGSPLALGVGVNTGQALVGNTGSTLKFKYGPLGHTVNLASRVQDATKKLNTHLLITGSTRDQLPATFATRRLGQFRLPGVADPVMLYELAGETCSAEWLARREVYETAQVLYEAGQWCKACQVLMPLLEAGEQKCEYDTPTLKLMRRAWECLEAPPEPFDPAIEIISK